MSFTANMPAAARRHLQAAVSLSTTDRSDVAGYLYGIAAECALKALMGEAGVARLPDSDRHRDPYFKHFPELKTLLKNMQLGRRGTILMRYVNDDAFLNNWAIQMRYSDGRAILGAWVEAWSKQAKDTVDSMGTQRR